MSKNWVLKTKNIAVLYEDLAEYPKFLACLLQNRGLVEKMDVQLFLEPDYSKLNSPFSFQDMQKAVDRIWQAIEKEEKICIYGDYDADAVTANAVLQQTFRYLGVQVESYIPDRFAEGYGINMEALAKIKASGCKVIITVDCGTNSIDAGVFCKTNGIDFIITDHHEVIGDLPEAYAIINPKNRNDKYPYENIVGVGVAFKLACGILSSEKCKEKCEKYVEGYEKWLLDLVAIGTVADCHSLVGENRILVKYGLKVLQKTKWVGLKALMEIAKIDFTKKPADTYTLGFVIAPRLNAAGRLEHADTALHLLMEQDPELAKERAELLEEINKRRQDQTLRIVSEAKEQAFSLQDRKVLVLRNEGWNKGIVGLVAGRMVEEFKKPVIVLEKGDSESTGSARTIGDFNVVEALKHSSELLVRFGGHKQAAGLTLKNENFEKFYEKILEFAEVNLNVEDLVPKLHLEAELEAEDLNVETFNLLAMLEPFGVDNIKPKFLVSDIKVNSIRQVGQNKQHAQITLEKDGKRLSSIAFSFDALKNNIKIGDTLDVAVELLLDSWNGKSELKLRLIDFRVNINKSTN